MKTNEITIGQNQNSNRRVPAGVRLAFTGFMAVLVPVYWSKYGPTNFLYFCDLALFLTLAAVWSSFSRTHFVLQKLWGRRQTVPQSA